MKGRSLLKSYETKPQTEEDTQALQEGDKLEKVQAAAQPVVERPRRKFAPPSRDQVLNLAPFFAIFALGAILRFWGLGDKPLHHDESLHAYYAWQLMLHDLQNWASCLNPQTSGCYTYDPLLHGPFQFHIIAITYQIAQWLGAAQHGINTTTVRIPAATLGSIIVGLPYFLRHYLGKWGALLASFFLAVSPSMVYFSRFAREDIYMACFTLLLVIGVVRYVQERKIRWIVLAAAGFALSYATSEATFLTIAIFGSFLGALIAWEIGLRFQLRPDEPAATRPRYLPRTAAPLFVIAYFIVAGVFAKIFLGFIDQLSIYADNTKTQPYADLFVQNLKAYTVAIVPWIGIILGVYVLIILWREATGRLPRAGRRGLAAKIDPKRQRMLDTILTMPWTHWFFALLLGWAIFLVLFTALFTDIRGGIGDGIWQGLYYWIQQQQVARGGQPWYYYLLLIPLYEQVGVVFGVIGVIRCFMRPTRFRMFLTYWFLGDFFIYSWAGEKMPWLMIFMTMPMMLLAAIGLEPSVLTIVNLIQQRRNRNQTAPKEEAVTSLGAENNEQSLEQPALPVQPAHSRKIGKLAGASAIFGVVMAFLLLLPTVHNMYEVSYIHAADGPHEMMVYVQTTYDVNTVMARIRSVDQKYYGGKHLVPIGIMNDATWPFAWYVRNYSNICFNYPTGCSTTASSYPIIIVGGDNLYSAEQQYAGAKGNYRYQTYRMRTWWDEGYKPLPCVPTKANKECAGQPTYGGVGLGLWLSYGDYPPPNATFNLGLAAKNIWDWWWYRKAIGSTAGAYPMGLFIRKGINVNP
jgi:uncharacterized protein (TIGR03663 family)